MPCNRLLYLLQPRPDYHLAIKGLPVQTHLTKSYLLKMHSAEPHLAQTHLAKPHSRKIRPTLIQWRLLATLAVQTKVVSCRLSTPPSTKRSLWTMSAKVMLNFSSVRNRADFLIKRETRNARDWFSWTKEEISRADRKKWALRSRTVGKTSLNAWTSQRAHSSAARNSLVVINACSNQSQCAMSRLGKLLVQITRIWGSVSEQWTLALPILWKLTGPAQTK